MKTVLSAMAAGLLGALLSGCGPNAAPASPTVAPTAVAATAAKPAATASPSVASSGAAVAAALTSVPKPAASPSASAGPASAVASGAGAKQYAAPPGMVIDPNKSYSATIETTLGSMKAELFAKDAPMTVNNFVFLARDGFYDGVTFHRVIKDFMAQTGDPTGTGSGGPGYKFKDEPVQRKYERGTLAMANSGPNTNGSQFFIVHKDYALPPQYTIFGKVGEGAETLDKITDVPTAQGRGGPNTPRTEIKINAVRISEQ